MKSERLRSINKTDFFYADKKSGHEGKRYEKQSAEDHPEDATYKSKSVQNEIIECLKNYIQNKIVKGVKDNQ